MTEVARFGAMCRLDAGSALGPAAAVRAVDRAIELARGHGLGLVAVGNSSHLGAAGFYARSGASQGFMVVVATNGPANMAPYGSSERFLGTNALAVAVPAGERRVLAVDMSCSVSARGKIIRAKEVGETIEPGLAIDPDGAATTDPVAALAGAVLPLGGPKGTGLALAISIAAGVLGGAGFDDEVAPMHGDAHRPQNLGHILLAIDPWALADREQAEGRIESLIERLHALRPAGGFEEVPFPGERGDREAERRAAEGIPIEVADLEALARTCRELRLGELADRTDAVSRGAAR